ncbi:MAG: tRNA1(Val) (adenine(37)-N6)-methyltransferase [Methylomicrobium sp.]
MKICTDSLLFGAMMPVKARDCVLDIGAGCGLLSLAAAQLGAGQVTAVELMDGACREAAENFQRSPWSDRLQAVRDSIQHFADTQSKRYDLIVSNPPFFENHLNAEEPMRNAARHDVHLKHAELVNIVDRLLTREGLFYVLLPVQSEPAFMRLCRKAGFHLSRQTTFRGYAHSTAKVTALTLGRNPAHRPVFETITVYDRQGVYSATACTYLAEFLMRFAAHESVKDKG